MYHIYSGTNEIPDSIDLIELASLTDLLGLEGLREVISQTIRQKFAHNFHRVRILYFTCLFDLLSYTISSLNNSFTDWF